MLHLTELSEWKPTDLQKLLANRMECPECPEGMFFIVSIPRKGETEEERLNRCASIKNLYNTP